MALALLIGIPILYTFVAMVLWEAWDCKNDAEMQPIAVLWILVVPVGAVFYPFWALNTLAKLFVKGVRYLFPGARAEIPEAKTVSR